MRDVSEVADPSVSAVRKRDAINLPLVAFATVAGPPLLDPFGSKERLSSFQSVTKTRNDFVGARVGPSKSNHFCEVPADRIRSLSKEFSCGGIHLANPKI